MPCLDENQLLELAEGTLAAAARASLEGHLDECEACRRLVAEVLRDTKTMPGAPGSQAPLPFAPLDGQPWVATQELARGGMGRVLKARDTRLGREVALKEMLPGRGDARRFEREARLTARLQHPSIVKVYEAGRWASGEPFYVMPLVAGRPLERVVAATRDFDGRLALLPNVLAVADAMASAHAQRIIHRDLKPANVLVGEYGETVVIDWGLAKDLAAADESAPGAPLPSPGSGDATVAGSVVGTPAYMAPEQAHGREVDERTDVYALGVMLDFVLSGRPAITGTSPADALARVREGPPLPLAQRQRGVPPELLALVARAMAREPADRYPTAREVAADLRRFLTGQLVGAHRYSAGELARRWVRKHRGSVSVGAVALVMLLGVGAVSLYRVVAAQRLAEAQRARADASRADAEKLVDFIVGDLNTRLRPLGRLELLRASVEQVTAYYARRQDLDDAGLARQGAARRRLGAVMLIQGETERALGEMRAALEQAERLAAGAPADAAAREGLAAAHYGLADVLLTMGDARGALTRHEQALALRTTAAAAAPQDREAQLLLADSHLGAGDALLSLERTREALQHYRATLALVEAAAARGPLVGDRAGDLTVARARVGDALYFQGELDGALQAYQQSLEVELELAAGEPSNLQLQGYLAVSYARLGDILLGQGAAARALASFMVARGINERLVALEPGNVYWRSALAYDLEGVGDVRRLEGDERAALEQYRAALAITSELAEHDPDDVGRARELSIHHEKMGLALQALGELEAAQAQLLASLALREALVKREPGNPEWRRDLPVVQEELGWLRLSRGDLAGALRDAEAALALREALARDAPAPVRQHDLGDSRLLLSAVRLAQGNAGLALDEAVKGQALLVALAQQDDRDHDLRLALLSAHAAVAAAKQALGDAPAARRELEAALAAGRRWAAARPEDAVLAKRLEKLGRSLAAVSAGGR